MKHTSPVIFTLACIVAFPTMAYVGPGPGLSMIGSFFTLLAGIGIALFFVLFYPIRLLLKRRKQKSGDISTKKTSD